MNLENYIRNVSNFPKEGIEFKDISPLLENPSAFRYSIQQMANHWQDKKVDKIGGFDARGFLFGTTLAYEMGLPFFMLRKPNKLPFDTISESYDLEYGSNTSEMHTDSVQKGNRVLLVDDLLATGGTMSAGCSLVEKVGGSVVGCQFVIELEQLNGRKLLDGYDVQTLLKYE